VARSLSVAQYGRGGHGDGVGVNSVHVVMLLSTHLVLGLGAKVTLCDSHSIMVMKKFVLFSFKQ